MNKYVNLNEVNEGAPEALFCCVCGTTIQSQRTTKKYCSANCRQKANRNQQNSASSITKARTNAEFFDRAKRLAEVLYTLPPEKRLGFMQQLIGEARAGNTKLREVLTNQKLLWPNPIEEKHLFHRSDPAYCTIAQAAQYYCKRFWKANVADVAYNRVKEPQTGEVISDRAVLNDNNDETDP